MRFLLKVNIPVEEANECIKKGTFAATMNSILSDTKPETVYFGAENGTRTAFIFLNMNDPSDIVKYAEPWFLAFNAEVEYIPVMNPDDLQKGSVHFEQLVKKYAV